MDKSLIQKFTKPGNEFRGAPFWAWNGKLDADELRWQIRMMQRMGLGGFFMHSRVGLDTEYLGPEWFKCVDACVDEAEKLGMGAWMYDEDRWPSGAAGGLITKHNPENRAKFVAMTEVASVSDLKWTPQTLGVWVATVDGIKASGLTRVAKGKKPVLKPGQTLLVMTVSEDPLDNWFNGGTYLDTLNEKAVKTFIKSTHELYRSRYRAKFGKSVPGMFTDEPFHGWCMKDHGARGLGLPWTPGLPAYFKKQFGYDVLAHLPELFFDVEGVALSRARYHYHETLTALFVNAFGRQVGEWCAENNLLFTGHVFEEDTLATQSFAVGSAMRFYEHMQAPGLDLLTEHWRIYDVAKQVSSVARQFGKKWRLTETYGCTGWDFPFAGHKALGDWQVALGINLRCQHLSWYTMEGEAKRDFPAGIFYQSPWWELYPKVEDYFARIHSVMTRGAEVRNLLVISPVESTWCLIRKGGRGNTDILEADARLIQLRDSLLMQGIDFDYGDEDIMARQTRVVMKKGVPTFSVGKADYTVVLVPAMLTIRASTLALLRKFRKLGGKVVFSGAAPAFVDAVQSSDAETLAAGCAAAPLKGDALVQALEPEARRVAVTDATGQPCRAALHLLREDAGQAYFFVCNTGVVPTLNETVPFDGVRVVERTVEYPEVRIRGFDGFQGAPIQLDPETGAMCRADATRMGKGWEIRTSLPQIGSRMFVIPRKEITVPLAPAPVLRPVGAQTLKVADWTAKLSECNVLVLDKPAWKAGTGAWQPQTDILRVDQGVRDILGIEARHGGMIQPWARDKKAQPKRTDVELRYCFEVATIPDGDLFLALEQPKSFRTVCVNGAVLMPDSECGWWCDKALRRIPVDPAFLKPGINEVRLVCDYSERHPGLEIVYLLGSFGVRVKDTTITMIDRPSTLKTGDWTEQGLPFFSGSVTYQTSVQLGAGEGERVVLRVPGYAGCAVRVLVDGQVAGVTAWAPNEVDVTAFANGGTVTLGIQVVGHRRNSHGPLHHTEKWPFWSGPGEFQSWRGDGKLWNDGYTLVPCGLMEAPTLEWRAT